MTNNVQKPRQWIKFKAFWGVVVVLSYNLWLIFNFISKIISS